MPELPEVEAARRAVRRAAVGRRIVSVRCADDPIVLQATSPRLRRALVGRRVLDVRRHGKHSIYRLGSLRATSSIEGAVFASL